jgi:hypothetical protein
MVKARKMTNEWEILQENDALCTWTREKWQGSYFILKKALEGKADIQKQTQRRPVYGCVTLRLEPRKKGFGYQTTMALPPQDVEDADQKRCIRAVFQGALDELMSHHLHPIRDVEIFLKRFFYDKPQSSRVVFWEAGREAIRDALTHPGGVGMTEDQDSFELINRA